MMKDVLERIEQRLKAVGKSAQAASLEAGLSKDAIRNMRRAAKEPTRAGVSTRTIEQLADVLDAPVGWLLTGDGPGPGDEPVKHNRDHGKALIEVHSSGEIPVIGEIAAGVWQEAIEMLDTGESIPFIPHPRFPKDAQLALRVRGDSCDLIAQPGAYVNTVPLEMALPVDGLEGLLREFEAKGRDLIVVAERLRGGLVEATLKALVRDRAGYALEARSSNPKWAGKIPLTDDMLREGDETRIARVMIGKYEVML